MTKQKAEEHQLLRFTCIKGFLTFDNPGSRKKNPGRGAYVLKDAKKIKILAKLEKKVSYVLKKSTKISQEEIEKALQFIALT